MNELANDIYKWVSPIDKKILEDDTCDFDLMSKLKQWKEVTPLDSLDKNDLPSFFSGKFSAKMF